MENGLDGLLAWRCITALVLLLQLTLIVSHRPWFDEWQALQIALQSPTLADLLANLRYEGHPPLWYFMLRGLAFVVPTFWVLPVAALLIAIPTQWLILNHAPFPRWQRLALALSAFVLFEYLTISRSLTLGVACMLFAVALRGTRWQWLPIAVLPQCDFLFGVISIALIAMEARRGRLWLPGPAAWLVSSALAAWSVIPAADMISAIPLRDFTLATVTFVNRLGLLLVPWQTYDNMPEWNGWLPFRLGAIAGPLFLVFVWLQVRGKLWHAGIMFGFIALNYVFSLAVYPLSVRHLGLIAMLLICLKWLEPDGDGPPRRMFGAWLAVGAACGLGVATLNAFKPFNTAHVAISYMREHGLLDKRWMVFPENRGQAISALSGLEFQREGTNCTQSFIRWNRRTPIKTTGQLARYLEQEAQRGRFYLLTDFRLEGFQPELVKQLTVIPAGYDGYAYVLSVIAPNKPENLAKLPPCAPVRRPLVQPTIWSR
ncbi:MAG: hypothetical protein ACKVOP_14190 [Sphingomonadaceae bacterium]